MIIYSNSFSPPPPFYFLGFQLYICWATRYCLSYRSLINCSFFNTPILFCIASIAVLHIHDLLHYLICIRCIFFQMLYIISRSLIWAFLNIFYFFFHVHYLLYSLDHIENIRDSGFNVFANSIICVTSEGASCFFACLVISHWMSDIVNGTWWDTGLCCMLLSSVGLCSGMQLLLSSLISSRLAFKLC